MTRYSPLPASLGALVTLASFTLPPSEARGDPAKDIDQHFTVDPVSDGVLIAGGAGTAGILELILSTGEIVPQRPTDAGKLLSIDRGAVTQTLDSSAGSASTVGLGVAIGFAVLDPILSGLRDGWDAALVDGVIYAETMSLTLALTDITKIAVRRPRPIAYIEQAALDKNWTGPGLSPSISDTDATLSFFSGHSALTASVTATATYLAFDRSPGTWRPWVTLGAGTLLTSFVAYERVRSGAHFPTDVIGGALAGAAIGVLVPHLHRHNSERTYWVGIGPTSGGGSLVLQGLF